MIKIQLKGKQKILVYVVVGILVYAFIGRFIFFGLGARLKQLKQQTKLAEANLKKGLETQKRKDIISSDYDKYHLFLAIEKMEQRQIIEELLKEVERIAKDSGASLLNLSPQEATEQDKRRYKADLRIEASAEQILNFLYKIQESKLLIKLDKISVSPKDEQASMLKAEATISIAVP